jgi:hypothetical protein
MHDRIWAFLMGLGLLVNAVSNMLLLRELRRRVQALEIRIRRLLRGTEDRRD